MLRIVSDLWTQICLFSRHFVHDTALVFPGYWELRKHAGVSDDMRLDFWNFLHCKEEKYSNSLICMAGATDAASTVCVQFVLKRLEMISRKV